jgi:hypothetical protein
MTLNDAVTRSTSNERPLAYLDRHQQEHGALD